MAAGAGLGVVGAGAMGAAAGGFAADQLAHSPMDRLAQELKDKVQDPYQRGNEGFQEMYAYLIGTPKSLVEQAALTQTLGAGIDSLERVLGPELTAEAMGSEQSRQLLQVAQRLHESNPQAAIAMANMGNSEIKLILRERELGLKPSDVVAAAEQGAGVSPVPATLGGLVGGLGGAAAMATGVFRSNPDAFQVPRRRP